MGFRQLFPVDDIDYEADGTIHLYTDGSCIRNGCADSAGGWAYTYTERGKESTRKIDSGGCKGTTNNRMEMTAVIEGLRCALKRSASKPITVYSDSQYVIRTLEGVYQPGKNMDLWNVLLSLTRKFSHIKYSWVKGHSDNIYNNEVDSLAVAQSKKYYSS